MYGVRSRRCPSAAGGSSYSASNASIDLVSFLSLFVILVLLFNVIINPSLTPLLLYAVNFLMTEDDQ